MPHRVSYKKDLGNAHKFSDSYDIDNIYLSEEGWVYRHFKNSERTLWWDEIIVAGQVNPDQVIHGVPNNDVVPTNPLKLGTAIPSEFQEGDKYFDYRYSDHEGAPDKIVIGPEDKPNKHNQIPWKAIVGSSALAGVVEETLLHKFPTVGLVPPHLQIQHIPILLITQLTYLNLRQYML